MTTSVQKRDESGLKAVKRVLCRRQAVTYRHTCEPARKGFSREIRRKRSPMRKMPEQSLHICTLSLGCLLFSPLLGRTLTSLYSYLAILLDYHVCVQALMVLRRYKRCEHKTTHRRRDCTSFPACCAFWQLSGTVIA